MTPLDARTYYNGHVYIIRYWPGRSREAMEAATSLWQHPLSVSAVNELQDQIVAAAVSSNRLAGVTIDTDCEGEKP